MSNTLPAIDHAHLIALQAHRDALYRASSFRPHTYAEYDRAQDRIVAHLSGDPDPDEPDPYPLCPECRGQGYTITPGSYFDPPEPDPCTVCGGEGTLSGPLPSGIKHRRWGKESSEARERNPHDA